MWTIANLGGRTRCPMLTLPRGGYALLVNDDAWQTFGEPHMPKPEDGAIALVYGPESDEPEERWIDCEATLQELQRSAEIEIRDNGCECGSGLPSSYSLETKGHDCAWCRETLRVHKECGTAFYAYEGNVCDECGKE